MRTDTNPAIAIDHDLALARAGANVTGWGSQIFYQARRHPLGAFGLVVVLLFVVAAVFAGTLSTHDPLTTNPRVSLAAPGAGNLLGADFMGRDMYSRIIYGARISLVVGISSTFIGCILGVLVGLISGFWGGWLDLVTQRVIDIMQALPLLVLALVMAASLGPSIENTIIAIAIPLTPTVARVSRAKDGV